MVGAQANHPAGGSTVVTLAGSFSEIIEQVADQANGILQGVHERFHHGLIAVLFLHHLTELVFDFLVESILDVELGS